MNIKTMRRGTSLLIFIVTLFSFPVIERSVRGLHKTFFHVIAHFSEYQKTAMVPDDGIKFFNDRAVMIKEKIDRYHLPHYRLSVEFAKNAWDAQSTIALLWPLPLDPNSVYLFMLPEEPLPKNCKMMDATGGMKLAQCQ